MILIFKGGLLFGESQESKQKVLHCLLAMFDISRRVPTALGASIDRRSLLVVRCRWP